MQLNDRCSSLSNLVDAPELDRGKLELWQEASDKIVVAAAEIIEDVGEMVKYRGTI